MRVVENYYAALARHKYRAAHALWPNGRSVAALRQGYAETKWVRVIPQPPFGTEGAAGSIYATIPVRIEARLINDVRQHFAGTYTLRRVNDVDGSTAAQRRWHIVGGSLRAVPVGP